MKILVFGRSGQLATSLAETAAARGHGAACLGRTEADLAAAPGAAADRIAAGGWDAVVNAAAWTAVDAAEAEPEAAARLNAHAPGILAAAAAAAGIPFLHVSTDYVFPGTGARPWREDDPTAPLGVYGRTKRDGERAVAAAGGPHVVLRTAWVFSATGANFVKTMLRLGKTRPRLGIVADQRGGPTPADAIADAVLDIAEAFAAGRGESGVFHFAGAPATTWADFAAEIFAAAKLSPKIDRIPTSDYPTPAARPLNSVLDCNRIRRVYGIAQPDWRTALPGIVAQLETT